MNAPQPISTSRAMTCREADSPIDPLFVRRWSPRAFEPVDMAHADLHTVLEAARWAPSAYNIQPWRFIYAHRDDPCWDRWVGLLDPFNAAWAHCASVLVFLVTDTLMPARGDTPRRPSRSHSFDAGAAWAQLALQATQLGYQAHAMAGIDVDRVKAELDVPDHYRVEIGIAIGRVAAPDCLPVELRAREVPSGRMPLAQIAFHGRFDRTAAGDDHD